jgi:acetylornithine/succinyldiaminopimelate/putrescine aminotransferase
MLAVAHERAKLYQATLRTIKGVMLNWLAKIAKVASLGHTNSQLVEALKSQGNDLLEISESFVERGEYLDKIYSFFEQEKLYGSIVRTFGQEEFSY